MSDTHLPLNLREVISSLERLSPNLLCAPAFGEAGSWRGDYACIAFAPRDSATVREMLSCARAAVGATFTGYKGGKYLMTFSTECYVAEYGVYGGDDDALSLARFPWLSPDATEALTLRARVAELEANNEGSLKAAAYWKENWQRSEAHAATLREALEEAAAHMWGNQKRCGCLNECIHTGEVVRAALAATPAASLAAHDAEVGMRVVSECAMTMRSKCNCTHCDENAPGWEGRAIVERALAAQEVKRTEERWECPTCGLGVAADEDGCCAMCGADCKAQQVKP